MNRIRLFPKDFLKAAFSIGLPIALQSFITTSVNMVDVVMLGHLGDVDHRRRGRRQPDLLSPFAGALRRELRGIGLHGAVPWEGRSPRRAPHDGHHVPAGAGGLAAVLGGRAAHSGAADLDLLARCGRHRRRAPPTCASSASPTWRRPFSYTMGFACRATGNVRLPMLTSLLSVATNTLLNSILIFGLLGFPELGLRGRGDRHGHRARRGAHGAGHGRLPQAHARRGEFPPALPAL